MDEKQKKEIKKIINGLQCSKDFVCYTSGQKRLCKAEDEMGLFLPVIEAHASYKRAARYDDLLQVVTILRDAPVARVRLDYEIYKEGEKELLADGYTIHSFVNAETGKPTRAPAQFVEAIEKAIAGSSKG